MNNKELFKELKLLYDRMDIENPHDKSYRDELGLIMLGIQEGWEGVSPTTATGLCSGAGPEAREGHQDALEALKELRQHNSLRGDFDAYLFELTKWGLGERPYRPVKTDFGL